MMSCPIVLACDEGYAMQLATSLRSIAEANQDAWPLDFHLLSGGFSEYMQKKVLDSLPKGSASIRWVPVDLRPFQEFATLSYISKMTYARFLIAHIFPDTVSKVLYLDADLLVLDNLELLWETDLKGYILAAVLDHGLDPKLKLNEPGLEEVPRVRDYFNAGVLLVDLARWRKERISEKALEYLTRHPRSPYSDQDALNVVCDGFWKKLDQQWNFQDHLKKRISHILPKERPKIVHFVMSLKPWDASALSVNAPFYDIIRSRTRFARTPWDKMRDILQSGWSRLKRVLREYSFLLTIWGWIKRPQ